jgi:DNA polymerase-3 subunit delta
MLYLFFGADELARTEALNDLRATLPPDLADLNIAVLDGRKLRVEALSAACDVLPLLSDRRLVIVEDALKSLRSNDACDAIKAYLPKLPPTTDLVFVEREDVDKRLSLYTYLKKAATVKEFVPKTGVELQRWLQERARQLQAHLQPAAGELLVEYVGNDSRALLNELSKLATYTGPGGVITPAEVRLLVQDSSESSVFEFVDALAARRLDPALARLRGLLDDGQAPTYLLFMLARQVRILLQVKELAERRMRPAAIASVLNQKPFVVRKALEQAMRFSAEALLQLHDRLVELDHWTKTGRIDPEAALELFVAEACASGWKEPVAAQPQRQ